MNFEIQDDKSYKFELKASPRGRTIAENKQYPETLDFNKKHIKNIFYYMM